MRRLVLLAGGLLALALPTPPASAVPFAPGAELLSASRERQEQGDDATAFTTVSQDGRWVVFDTRATNFFADDDVDPSGQRRLGGVFRKDRVTGALSLVAHGDVLEEEGTAVVRRGAHTPSVSGDGRFVVFSTAEKLVAADTNDNVDVYRRDLDVPRGDARAYVLVSAKDGGDIPASYAPRDPALPGRNPGADLFSGRALSADGRFVVFRTTEASDLPSRAVLTDVPAGQLLVRDVAARTTRLLTRRGDDPVGGAAGPAVISADGSTVAWVGGNAPLQTRFLEGEQRDNLANYYLYKRIGDANSPTRRITGLADPDDPGCNGEPITQDPTAVGPCYGPLSDSEEGRSSISNLAPALSADGLKVAFLASGGRRPAGTNNPAPDLFVTDMRPGLSRKAATVELTRDSPQNDPANSAPIQGVSMSADGRALIFSTVRNRFLLPALTPTGPAFRNVPDERELFFVDLEARTVERVLRAADGGDVTGGVSSAATASGDGRVIAFSSGAGDLFFGDANEQPDAFAVERPPEPIVEVPPPVAIEPPVTFEDADEPLAPEITVRLQRLRTGALRATVGIPAPGSIVAFARTRAKKARTVARGRRTATRAGSVRIDLKLSRKEQTRLRRSRSGRLSVRVRVRFVPQATGARALTELVDGRFQRPAKKKVAKRKKRRSR